MNKLLKGLELREQIGGLVQPFAFDEKTRTDLRRWLDDAAIDRLQGLTELARQVEVDNRDEPTLRDNRAVLDRIRALAAALGQAIEQAPSIADGQLTLIGHRDFGDVFKFQKMAIDLERAAACIGSDLEKMPKQSTRGSHIFMVSCIAEIAVSQGIKVSEATHARFPKLCQCVFESTGIWSDVRPSIRAFLAKGHNR